MRDRTEPCIHYTSAHADCGKGFRDVTMKKCKNCQKYRPRKSGKKKEKLAAKRQKDKDRHDDWRKRND